MLLSSLVLLGMVWLSQKFLWHRRKIETHVRRSPDVGNFSVRWGVQDSMGNLFFFFPLRRCTDIYVFRVLLLRFSTSFGYYLDQHRLLLPPIRGRRIVKKLEYRILRIPANANTKYRIPNRRIANTEYRILVCIKFYVFLKNSALISKYAKYSMMIFLLWEKEIRSRNHLE